MSKRRILIVEDEAIVALAIRHRLESLGYAVDRTVASGDDAIRSISESQPNLVLMDIMIDGDMDGIEAAARIRGEHSVPIIYITGNSDPATLARARATNPQAILIKPVVDDDLASTIEGVLAG
ncbi:MAG: response regulator [Spirochaetota bacterium]